MYYRVTEVTPDVGSVGSIKYHSAIRDQREPHTAISVVCVKIGQGRCFLLVYSVSSFSHSFVGYSSSMAEDVFLELYVTVQRQ